jgi:rhodanese-related sulfurtransferase
MATPNRRYKSAIYEQFARVGKAIANPARIELLDLLSQGPRTVEALAKEAGLGLTNASQQLKALRAARLVEAEKQGLFVTYRLADPEVGRFLHAFRSLSELRLAEIGDITRRFLESRHGLEPVDRESLVAKVRAGAVTVLDVRPPEEYSAGHLPKAVSIPLKELESRLKELPKRREIVAYCRGPYCVLAIEAVEMLRAKGFTAFRLEDGVSEWQARGYSVEHGARQ